MKNRLCVIMIGLQSETARRMMEGISVQAHVLGYDVFVYTYFGIIRSDQRTISGEANILNLINSNDFDGFIIQKEMIPEYEYRQLISEICRKSGKPVLDIDDPDGKDEEYPLWNDREKMFTLTEHMITVHDCKKIYCITGYKGLHHSENRLLGYRDALIAHGITPCEEWEFYGDFWKSHAEGFADRLASGELSMPDAVVCAATIPAVALIDRLKLHDIKIPDDLLVAGYDCFIETIYESPEITFISFPTYNQGINSVCRIHKMITGKSVVPVSYFNEELCAQHSCGCHTVDNPSLSWLKQDFAEQHMYLDFFRNSGMQEALSSMENENAFFVKLWEFEYLIRGIRRIVYFLCDDWNSVLHTDANEYRNVGYSDTLHAITHIHHVGGSEEDVHSRDITAFLSRKNEPSTYYLFPMHYSDRAFGFVALDFSDNRYSPDVLFWQYREFVENSLENLRIRQYISRFSERKRIAAVRDNLTGFYNKRGFEEYSMEMYEYAVIHDEKFRLFAVKIQNLDEINRLLGYQESDEIILRLAELISKSLRNNEIPCRIRGGTFYTVGTSSGDRLQADKIKKRFLDECSKIYQDYEKRLHIQVGIVIFEDKIGALSLESIVRQVEMELNKHMVSEVKYRLHIRSIVQLRSDIYRNPEHQWTIEEILERVSLSRGYFQRLYKEHFSVSVSADISRARIEKAKQMLTEGFSISEISEKCGYHHESYFLKRFKMETGLTPTEWKNNHT